MKYIKYIILIGIAMIALLPTKIMADSKITVYLFHGSTCPHCQAGIEYLESIKNDYSNIELVTYEVWDNVDNAKLFENVKKSLESDSKGVPFFVIGNRYLTGFNEYRKTDIKDAINYYIDNNSEYKDVVNDVINGKNNDKQEEVKDTKYESVNISDVRAKKTYKEILYLGGAVIILIIVYIGIRIHEKRVK